MWQPFGRRRAPMSQQRESEFVTALRDAAGPDLPDAALRDDMTLVLNALRCGLDLLEVEHFAPGVAPGRLLAAYLVLDRERVDAVRAWNAVVRDPAQLPHLAESAQRILPHAIARALAAYNDDLPLDVVAALVADYAAEVHQVQREALRIEREMVAAPDEETAATIGLRLYNPLGTYLWDHPAYLATRVGTLSPTRVADLLGERQDSAVSPDDVDPPPPVPR